MYHSFISSSPSPLHFLRSFYFHRYSFALFLLLFSLVFVILFIFVPSLPSPFGCSTLPRQLSLCRIQHGDCVSAIGSESVTWSWVSSTFCFLQEHVAEFFIVLFWDAIFDELWLSFFGINILKLGFFMTVQLFCRIIPFLD